MMRLAILLFILALIWGCAESPFKRSYRLGRNALWYPLDFKEKKAEVTAFSTYLVNDIGKQEHLSFSILESNWNTLFDGLYEDSYDAVLAALPLNEINEKKFDFSIPFLLLGPVLIVRVDSAATSLQDLDGKLIGISPYDDSELLIQKYPTILMRKYEHMPLALTDLSLGEIDAVVMGTLPAHALVKNLYPNELKIVTAPLDDSGLRLVTLKGKHLRLIKAFDRGLEALKKSGRYQELQKLFNLGT